MLGNPLFFTPAAQVHEEYRAEPTEANLERLTRVILGAFALDRDKWRKHAAVVCAEVEELAKGG